MDFFVEGEVSLICFEGGLSCKKRLFFGEIVLTNYRLITVSTSIQKNPSSNSEIWKHHLNILSIVSLKRDSFLAKLNKQKLAEGILHLDKVYQFPTTKVFKKKVKNNQFLYDTTLEYEEKGVLKKKVIRIRIQPKRNKMLGYKLYKARCEEIFSELNKILKIE